MSFDFSGINMATRSQMIGFPQQVGLTKHVQKEEKTEIQEEREKPQIREKEREEDKTQISEQAPKTHQRKAQQVIRRFVAETGETKDAKQTQEKDTKHTQIKAQERDEKIQQEHAKAPVDNASRIGLMYQQSMRNKRKLDGQQAQVDQAGAQPKQLKRFLSNLRQYVNMEYKQYTNPDISTYTRRNLREILAALGEGTKAFDDKAAKDRRDRQTGNVEDKKFNKFYAATASKQLKLFNEDPIQDFNYTPFQLVV
jgi:hypothetical protein